MIPLPILAPGDRVAVVAPSSPLRPEMLEEGLARVRELGLEPAVRPDILARETFFAGSEARRLAELEWALSEPDVRAIWVARGGYGATPLLRALDASRVAAAGRPVIGESDTTALGLLWRQAGVPWLHGPMVAGQLRLGDAGFDAASLRAGLFGAASHESRPEGTRTLRAGSARGELWGGCLTLLAPLAGTPWLVPPERGVLVLEDVGVKPYQVHRMLVQLRDAGALRGVAGVVLGDFSDCVQHADQGYDVLDVIAELLERELGPVPVSAGWPIGHAPAPHLTLPMGYPARLVAPEAGPATLTWTRPE